MNGDLLIIGAGGYTRVVIDKLTIGNNVIVGAGSTIVKDVESGDKVVGVSKIINK